jgi:hypothetical protein
VELHPARVRGHPKFVKIGFTIQSHALLER